MSLALAPTIATCASSGSPLPLAVARRVFLLAQLGKYLPGSVWPVLAQTELGRDLGFAWGVGGFLLTPFLQKLPPQELQALRQRVVSELKTTFASHYTKVISLQEALQPDIMAAYNKRATGEKYLINPNKA